MHVVPPARAFRVVDVARRVRHYASLADIAAAFLDASPARPCGQTLHELVRALAIAVRDGEGESVPVWAIAHEMCEVKAERRAARSRPRKAGFRDGPVPGVRRRRGGSMYRHVATFNEIRSSSGWEADLAEVGYSRPVCRPRRPPTLWDDIVGCDERGWKSHRRTQWRGR